jgi:hypothetical protein
MRMSTLPRRRFAESVLLAWLLVLAQSSGFATVLCVSGSDHIQVESLGTSCCMPRTSSDAGLYGDVSDHCVNCTDMPMQTASSWNSSRRQNHDCDVVVVGAVSLIDVVPLAVPERTLDTGNPFLPSGSPMTTTLLRC